MEQRIEEQRELAHGFALVRGARKATLQDDVLAGACMAALDVALNHWQASKGKEDLGRLLKEAYAVVFPDIPAVDLSL